MTKSSIFVLPDSNDPNYLKMIHSAHMHAINTINTYRTCDAFRSILIDAPDFQSLDSYQNDDDSLTLSQSAFDELCESLDFALDPQNYMIDQISQIALDESLCPLHRIDFAICFDDDDPECSQIRQIFPSSHDT